MPHDAPLLVHQGTVLPEWIDYNDHMNMAYYVLVFDRGTDGLLDYLGMDAGYRKRTGYTTFTLETHVTYERELREGDAFRVSAQLLDWDAKRLHYFEWLHHENKGFLAATTELILMHMNRANACSTPMPEGVRGLVESVMAAHAHLPRPGQAGQVIGIRKRKPIRD